ncbi:hypothetical protein BJ166DRAFT_365981 [Pestalotiopsis sp. NC0098]|nr:hypothetical protein BJ166DRAFT_365981 [Pestalotiopsis sp. NC0098]
MVNIPVPCCCYPVGLMFFLFFFPWTLFFLHPNSLPPSHRRMQKGNAILCLCPLLFVLASLRARLQLFFFFFLPCLPSWFIAL